MKTYKKIKNRLYLNIKDSKLYYKKIDWKKKIDIFTLLSGIGFIGLGIFHIVTLIAFSSNFGLEDSVNNYWRILIVIYISFGWLIALGIGLYFFKEGSGEGRKVVWKGIKQNKTKEK